MQKQRYKELARLSQETIKKCDIQECPIDPRTLARKLGYDLRRYSDMSDIQQRMYNVDVSKPASTIWEDDFATIYYDDSSPFYRYHLAHEIAHRLLGHKADGPVEEEEANTLASFLLSPVTADIIFPDLKKRKLFFGIGTAVIACVFLFTGFQIALALYPPIDSESNIISVPAPAGVSQYETVYITKAGTKYHKPDCYVIKDKETSELNIADAVSQGYGSCQHCFGSIK